MAKKRYNFTLSQSRHRSLSRMAKALGHSRSRAIELMIDKLQMVFDKCDKESQHRNLEDRVRGLL